MYSLTFHVCVM